MNGMPNPDDFSIDEREGEYRIIINVSGEIHLTVEASSHIEAEKLARKRVEEIKCEEEFCELDEVTDAETQRVYKTKPMYRVYRDGAKMQVSRLEAGMTPREPDVNGF